jgi:hypothetical protein
MGRKSLAGKRTESSRAGTTQVTADPDPAETDGAGDEAKGDEGGTEGGTVEKSAADDLGNREVIEIHFGGIAE